MKMQAEKSLNKICMLQIDDKLSDENCYTNLNNIKSKLNDIGFDVEKICFIVDNHRNVCSEIRLSLINTHFIIIIVDGKHAENVKEYLSELYFKKSKSLEWKHLNLETNDVNSTVLYFQRIFLIDICLIEKSFIVIEKYLSYFIKPKPLIRFMKLDKGLNLKDINICDNGVKKELIEDSTLRISSCNLDNLLQCEANIKNHFNTKDVACTEFGHYLPHCLLNFNKFQEAFKVLEECFEKYTPECVCVCFNGGKDCTVLLHMTLLILTQKFKSYDKLCCLYVESKDPFPEIQEFIQNVTTYYSIPTIALKASIKESMEYLKETRPNIKACLMGTRRTDPFSDKLKSFEMTDADWPQFMRISPLLDWHYSDIWDYIHAFRLPYCNLYDIGYTSLGNVKNTQPNPHLLIDGLTDESSNEKKYLPAYKLIDENWERSGRLTGVK